MEHTPGEWRVMQHGNPDYRLIPLVIGTDGSLLPADASLIAAAPALLRGCQAALAYLAEPPSAFPENREEAERIIRTAVEAAK